jgi:uncharacterized protein
MSRTVGIDHRPVKHRGLLAAGGCLTAVAALVGGAALVIPRLAGTLSLGDLRIDAGCGSSGDRLIAAAGHDDAAAVRAQLARHAAVNGRDADGRTALTCAVQAGDTGVVEQILSAGADPNEAGTSDPCPDLLNGTTGTCATPLADAVEGGRSDLVTLLVDHGADPSAGLFEASVKDNVVITTLLLDRGARPAGTDPTSPLLYDVVFANHDLAELLLAHGADPNDGGVADAGMLQLMVGLRGASPPNTAGVSQASLQALVCGERGTATNLPPLVVAAALGDQTSVTDLLDHGADPNAPADLTPAVTPLAAANSTGATDVAALLVRAGARPTPASVPVSPPARTPTTGVC